MNRKAHKVLQARTRTGGKTLIIDNANEVVTVAGDNRNPRTGEVLRDIGIVEHGSVVLKDGLILDVGPRREVMSSLDTGDATVIDASGKVVLPGLVDPHTHLVFAGSRERELRWKIEGASYTDIAERGGGIISTMNATRNAAFDDLYKTAADRLTTMLRHGTTTVESKSGYGLSTEDEIKILRVSQKLAEHHVADVTSTFLGAHAVPPEFADNPDGYVQHIIEDMLPIVADDELAEFCDVFCEDGYFDIEQSRSILTEGRLYGLVPKIHADELTDIGGAELAAEVGAISADHLEMSSEKGLRDMAERNVVGVLLPGTSFTTDIGYADARKMIALGVPIALATDFNPNCWTKSMQFIISLACYKLKMLPAEAIVASTINAAHAIGRAHDIGSIEPGKKGDLIILDIENHEQMPYRFAKNHVNMVIKDGNVVFSR